MQYLHTTLENGLRIVHYPMNSSVSYCGFSVLAGSRNELDHEQGMAHFTEHMLFKGTGKRRAHHILNRMESVGGELNAFTSKEETTVYTVCLSQDTQRACELLCDIMGNSIFPEQEISKEVDVIIDEINSYLDSPAELIYDEFENKLFQDHALGHHILGDEARLKSFTSEMGRRFTDQWYQPQNMVFFFVGETPHKELIRYIQKYFPKRPIPQALELPKLAIPKHQFELIEQKDTHQAHVIVGSRAYDIHNPQRVKLALLNNILGGPCMNSLLNISLREKRGLVYQVESNFTPYTDTGVFHIYFGCEPQKRTKCLELVHKELKLLREQPLSSIKLHRAKNQIKGQMGISSDNKESIAMGLAKSFLHYNHFDTLEETFKRIDAISAQDLQEVAQELFDPQQLCTLIYE